MVELYQLRNYQISQLHNHGLSQSTIANHSITNDLVRKILLSTDKISLIRM